MAREINKINFLNLFGINRILKTEPIVVEPSDFKHWIPIYVEVDGLVSANAVHDIIDILQTTEMPELKAFLDGDWLRVRHCLEFVSRTSVFPDENAVKAFARKMVKNDSPFIRVIDFLDCDLKLDYDFDEGSVQTSPLISEKEKKSQGKLYFNKDRVYFAISFDLKIRLRDKLKALSAKKMEEPQKVHKDCRVYSLLKTLCDNVGDFYLSSGNDYVIKKNKNDKEIEKMFLWEFVNYFKKANPFEFLQLVAINAQDPEWSRKLEFWVNFEEKFKLSKKMISCVGTNYRLSFDLGLSADSSLLVPRLQEFSNYLKEFQNNSIQDHNVLRKNVNKSELLAFFDLDDNFEFVENFFLGISNMADYLENVFCKKKSAPKNHNLVEKLGRIIYKKIQIDPVFYIDIKNPVIKKQACHLLTGSL